MSGEIIWVEFPTDAAEAVLRALRQTPHVQQITHEKIPPSEYVALGIEGALDEVGDLPDFLWAIPLVNRAWFDLTPNLPDPSRLASLTALC